MSVGEKEHLDELTLSLLVDDLLDGQETERCYGHMDQCKDCETAFENLQAIAFAMAKLEDVVPPIDFTAQVMAKLPPQEAVDASKTIEIKEHRVKKSFLAHLPMGQVACFAAVAMFGLTFLQNPPSVEEAMHTRDMESVMERETMTLGGGVEETGWMVSAMPMDLEGEEPWDVDSDMMGERSGTSHGEYDPMEDWQGVGGSVAITWEELRSTGSDRVPILEEYLLNEGLDTPDVVLYGLDNPDAQLFTSVKERNVPEIGSSYHYGTAVLWVTEGQEMEMPLFEHYPELVDLIPLEEEITLLLLYPS